MGRYFGGEALRPEIGQDRMAAYLGGGSAPPLSAMDGLALAVADGDLAYGVALDLLMRDDLARPENANAHVNAIEERVGAGLADASERIRSGQNIALDGASMGWTMPHTGAAVADALGIDLRREPTQAEVANLLTLATRADGGPIQGKEIHKPRLTIAEAFGLHPKAPPSGPELRRVLDSQRADGTAPRTADGEALSAQAIAGARRRFLAMLDVPVGRDATPEEVAHMVAGRTARGLAFNASEYQRRVTASHAPVAYVEFVFSADKSLSVAWGLARNEAERAALLAVHNEAVAGAMAHVQHLLGHASVGKSKAGGTEAAELAGIGFTHTTSRPSVETIARDAEGNAYTDIRAVPVLSADMQLHTHVVVPNALVTAGGRVTSIDLDRLGGGAVKEGGAVYQALVAQGARRLGADVALDQENGAARLVAIPEHVRSHFSGRRNEGEMAAREYAAGQGVDWETLSEPNKRALLQAGARATRRSKNEGGRTDFEGWERRAQALGYEHRTVLRPDSIAPELTPAQRHELAYGTALPMLADRLSRNAKLGEAELREIAARSLIVAGVGNPAEDIAAVTRLMVMRGVEQDGRTTRLIVGQDAPVRGKERIAVTTALHADQESRLIELAGKAHADRSAALSPAAINRAADRSGLDFSTEHGRAQRAMMQEIATGGRLVVAIGAAGSGKTTTLGPVIEAWKAVGEGRTIYGTALAWQQASALVAAGIAVANGAAVEPFIRRAEGGKYALDRKSLVVVDELGQLGTRQLLRLLELQEKHGFKLVAVGDPKQAAAIEAGPVVDLLRRAIGSNAIPELLTTIRQQTERERETAGLFREGRAAEALARKFEDGSVRLVAGNKDRVIEATAALWRERMEANKHDPEFRLTVTAPTNADAREIGVAIRAQQRAMGLLGADEMTLETVDRRARAVHEMPLAVGDRVRLFDRVYDADAGGRRVPLASNGDVLEVRGLSRTDMRVRNDAGVEGRVLWDKLRAGKGEPVRLAYGAARTIDATQGATSTEHINALPSGSRAVNGFKAYVAESRHRVATWLVVSDSAERQEISRRLPLGAYQPIRQADVVENIARNLSRQPEKASATAFLEGARDRRQGAAHALLGVEAAARRQRQRSPVARMMVNLPDMQRIRLPDVAARVRQMAHAARERLTPQQYRSRDYGRRPTLGR